MIKNDDLELLRRNLLFFRANCKKKLEGDPVKQSHSERVFDVIEGLVEKGRIADMLGVEAVYYYCMDKMKEESSKLDQYANEIIAFIS